MIRVSTSYLHMALLIRGREFDQRRDKQYLKKLYNTYSYIMLTRPPKVIVISKEISCYCGNAGNDILTSAHTSI